MFKIMYEIEVSDGPNQPTYIYIEADEDIEINHNISEKVTHIGSIDTECGVDPDLILTRRKD